MYKTCQISGGKKKSDCGNSEFNAMVANYCVIFHFLCFFYVGEGMADAVNTMINGTNTINIMCYIFHIQ